MMGWASNFAQIFALIEGIDKAAKGKEGEVKLKDEFWDNDLPNPLPNVGAKVKVTGTYGVTFTKATGGAAAEPEVRHHDRREDRVPRAPRRARLPPWHEEEGGLEDVGRAPHLSGAGRPRPLRDRLLVAPRGGPGRGAAPARPRAGRGEGPRSHGAPARPHPARRGAGRRARLLDPARAGRRIGALRLPVRGRARGLRAARRARRRPRPAAPLRRPARVRRLRSRGRLGHPRHLGRRPRLLHRRGPRRPAAFVRRRRRPRPSSPPAIASRSSSWP